MLIILSCSNFSICYWFFLKTVAFAKGWFSMSIILPIFMNWKSFSFYLIYLFNQVCICQYELMYIYFILRVILLYFVARIGPTLTVDCSFRLAPKFLWHILILLFFEHFLLSGIQDASGASCTFPAPVHFSKENGIQKSGSGH